MYVEIKTRVGKTISEDLGNNTIMNSNIEGRHTASISVQGQEMILDRCDTKQFRLDSTTGPLFSLDLLSSLGVTADKIKFIHIQCYKDKVLSGDVNAPYRFSLELNGSSIGKLSQFQILNADTLSTSSIIVSNIEIPSLSSDYAILEVVFGVKS